MAVYEIRGAWRNLNCKGKGPETFRKVWRCGRWQWVSGYLPRGKFLAGDRCASTTGPVESGEIVASFSRILPQMKCQLENFQEVLENPKDTDRPLLNLEYKRKTLTTYEITKKNGETVELPDPLSRD